MFTPSLISRAVNAVSISVQDIVSEIASGEVETETSATDRLVSSLKRSINGAEHGDVQLFARTLRDRGPGAPEKEFGADLCIVLRARVRGYTVNKGLLVQAKRPKAARWRNDLLPVGLEGGLGDIVVGVRSHYIELPNDGEFTRSQDQCRTMLSHTPASFVFIYTATGIFVTPAVAFAGVGDNAPPVIASKTLPVFFADFLRCYVGDPRLAGWSDQDLRDLRQRTDSRNLLVVDAFPAQYPPPESVILG